VETFALVRLHLDVVRCCEREEAARRSEDGQGLEQHDCGGCVLLAVVVEGVL
jgi:hypothetical protein